MPGKPKKSPADYPLFSFRLSVEQKEELSERVEEIRNFLNKKIGDNEKLWMKNDVLFRALQLGLPLLKKNTGKN